MSDNQLVRHTVRETGREAGALHLEPVCCSMDNFLKSKRTVFTAACFYDTSVPGFDVTKHYLGTAAMHPAADTQR